MRPSWIRPGGAFSYRRHLQGATLRWARRAGAVLEQHSGAGKLLVVDRFDPLDLRVDAEPLHNSPITRVTEALTERRIGQEAADGAGERLRIRARDQEAVDAIRDHLRDPADRAGDDGDASSHGLEDRDALGLAQGGQ